MTTLLVLLVGELLTPFHADLRDALPRAFPEGAPEVALGPAAPPGRTVAWVSVQAGGLEVEVVLHTARVPGDLRRVLRFTAADAPKDRARATAFTLAAMVREREADLQALEPRLAGEPVPVPEAPSKTEWLLDASLLVGFNVPHVNAGAGGRLGLRRALAQWLQLGFGFEVGGFGLSGATLLQPGLFAEAAVPLLRAPFSLSGVVGGGVAAPIVIRGQRDLTTWLPLLRLAVEGRVPLGAHHGLRFALSAHLVPSSLSVRVGEMVTAEVGPAWLRPELGYFVEL